ncbi:hypothetical protein [Serratia phage SP1]|nr:hypothetical protein [Serratia phage SP1]
MTNATISIQTFDLEHTTETLKESGISYTTTEFTHCWTLELKGERSAIENWMQNEYCVGMEEEIAAEFMADIENI